MIFVFETGTYDVVGRFSEQTMDEVARAERARHERGNHLPVRRVHAHLVTDVHEHALMAQRHQRELAEVGVRREVLQSVELMASLVSMGKTITKKVTNRLAEKAV